jgi:hypothetical protein
MRNTTSSVLGPLLFILFINDLPDGIKSDVYLFAVDTKIFRNITDGKDKEILQDDLENLENLSNTWLLKFHPEKCKHMNIARVEKKGKFKYKLSGKNIERVQKEKDIGVTIESELTFESHICEKVNKATSIFGALRRAFRYLDKRLFIPLYKTMVITQLDYATSVWAPYKKKHIDMIENVQKRATKQIPGIKNLSYEERLRKLELPTLSYRRLRGDMIEVYQIIQGHYDPEASTIIKLMNDTKQRFSTRTNSRKVVYNRANTNIRQNSFSIE